MINLNFLPGKCSFNSLFLRFRVDRYSQSVSSLAYPVQSHGALAAVLESSTTVNNDVSSANNALTLDFKAKSFI